VPHPRMAVRRFVLEPADEVGSEMIHPLTGWTVRELLQAAHGAPHYLAIAGIDARQTMNLAVTAAQISGAHPLLTRSYRRPGHGGHAADRDRPA